MKAVFRNPEAAASWVRNLTFADQPHMVSVTRYRRPRSLDQNAKMHAMFRELAQHIGYADTELKEWVKAEYGPTREIRIRGKTAVVPKSTSEYNVQEAGEMIEILLMLGADCGCTYTETNNGRGAQ